MAIVKIAIVTLALTGCTFRNANVFIHGALLSMKSNNKMEIFYQQT